MKSYIYVALAVALVCLTEDSYSIVVPTGDVTFRIEPDDYADGTPLTNIHPAVTLFTALDDNRIVPQFTIESKDNLSGISSTGTHVFSHVGIDHWPTFRRLYMDFTQPVSSVSIDFIGGHFTTTDFGRLDIYNDAGQLLDFYETALLQARSSETMTLTRAEGDIAYALAYSGDPLTEGFGRLDNLSFTRVPEPASCVLTVVGVGACLWWRLAKPRIR